MIIVPYEISKDKYEFRYVDIYKFKWNCPKCGFGQGMEVIPDDEKYGGPNVIQTEKCGRCENIFQFKIIQDQKHYYVLDTLEEDKK